MSTLAKLRAMVISGRHLYECFASPAVRATGWKQMQDAKRIARKLKINTNLL